MLVLQMTTWRSTNLHVKSAPNFRQATLADFVGDPGLVGSGPVGPCSGIYYNPCDRQTDMRTDIAYTYTVASRG